MKYENIYLQFAIISPPAVPDRLMTIVIDNLLKKKKEIVPNGYTLHNTNLRRLSYIRCNLIISERNSRCRFSS